MKRFHIVKIQLMYSAQIVKKGDVATYGAGWKDKDRWMVVDTREKDRKKAQGWITKH